MHVAADLISQAEHDPLAASLLVTDSEPWPTPCWPSCRARWPPPSTPSASPRRWPASRARSCSCDDIDQGLDVVDAYAAEHLEIQTRDAAEVAARVRNAGAIFVGPWAPVSLGDYVAGSNHVLPTGGCAVHSSGLSVQTFLRGIHVVDYDEQALRDSAEHVVALAQAEDLPAHGAAVSLRFDQRR